MAGEVHSLAEQVQRQTQQLWQQISQQVLQSAQTFYGNSLRSLDSQLENDRSQLQELLQQLPDSQQHVRAQIEQLVSSYEAIEESLDRVAQQQSVRETASQALQQGREAAGQATEEAQELAGQAPGMAEGELHATKAAKRKAQDLGVDLSEVAGSSANGLITLKDVLRAARG